MKFLICLLSLSLFGCYVSKVGISLDADNASVVEITAHSPTNSSELGLDKKLKVIRQRLASQNIPFGYSKTTETIPVKSGGTVEHFKYPITVKLRNSEKAEKFSQIVADEMKISLNDFWYKVSEPEESDAEKRWHLSLAFKPQARPANVSESFQLTVKMPEKVNSYTHVPDKANLKSKMDGKTVTYNYKRMNTNALYQFEVTAVRKKIVPTPQTQPIVNIENNPTQNANITVLPAQPTMTTQDTAQTKPSPEPWFNGTLQGIAGLLTAFAALMGAWVAFRSRNKKTD